jgi:uncharacterized RDD family membrane protein YckC
MIPEQGKFCPKCGALADSEYNSSGSLPITTKVPELKVALWGERFVAWLIDVVIVGFFVGFLSLLTWVVWQPFSFMPSWFPLVNFGSGGVIYFVYWTLMDAVYGQSIGKMIMHLKVVKSDGRPIDLGDAALESVGKAFFLLLDFLVGWGLYPQRRQRIFNYLSETKVVQK